MKSQSIVAYGEALEETTSDTPEPKGREVLVKVSHCGVCHSDVHLHDGHFDMGGGNQLDVKGGRKLPFTLGHEIEGVVEAVGPDVEGIKPGDDYVVYPWIGCGECAVCERGDEHYCGKPRQLGINIAGGFATHVLVPDQKYLLDRTGVTPGLAATYMCSGLTAYSALKRIGEPGPDDKVVIVGCGGVGMMGIQFARALLSSAPLAADVDPGKLQAAQGAGAAAVYNPKDEDAIKQVIADTNGGAYAAIDFVGSESSLAFASSVVRKGGQVVVVGLFGGGFAMPIPMFPMRALTIGGSFVGSPQEASDMMELVRAGKVDPIPVEQRSMDKATQSLEDLRQGSVLGRVVLVP